MENTNQSRVLGADSITQLFHENIAVSRTCLRLLIELKATQEGKTVAEVSKGVDKVYQSELKSAQTDFNLR